jgi:hypothetical protein
MLIVSVAKSDARKVVTLPAPAGFSTLALRAENAAWRAPLTTRPVRTPSVHALTARDEPA